MKTDICCIFCKLWVLLDSLKFRNFLHWIEFISAEHYKDLPLTALFTYSDKKKIYSNTTGKQKDFNFNTKRLDKTTVTYLSELMNGKTFSRDSHRLWQSGVSLQADINHLVNHLDDSHSSFKQLSFTFNWKMQLISIKAE